MSIFKNNKRLAIEMLRKANSVPNMMKTLEMIATDVKEETDK